MTQLERDELEKVDLAEMMMDDESSVMLSQLDHMITDGQHDLDAILQFYNCTNEYINSRIRTRELLEKLLDEDEEYTQRIIIGNKIPFFWNCVQEFSRAVFLEEAWLWMLQKTIDEIQ